MHAWILWYQNAAGTSIKLVYLDEARAVDAHQLLQTVDPEAKLEKVPVVGASAQKRQTKTPVTPTATPKK